MMSTNSPMNISKERLKYISPTDISQFIRLEQCERYLRLRLHEKSINRSFMQDYGVTPQAIPPLLTLSGSDFEKEVEEVISGRFHKVNFISQDPLRQKHLDNNQEVVSFASSLQPNQIIILFQSRLYLDLDGWQLTGDIDVIRLERDKNGLLHILIVDMKSSTSVKVEHRLQVAFYQAMLTRLFERNSVGYATINTGILYPGPADVIKGSTPQEAAQYEKQRAEATRLLGTKDSFLEIIVDQEAYLDSVYDLLTGQDSTAHRVAKTPFEKLPYFLSYKCDGCLYNEFCMKWSAEKDDLSLLPYMSSQDKNALKSASISTVQEVALLKNIRKVGNSSTGQVELIPATGKETLVKKIAATWPVGPRLDELIYRARLYRKWKKDNIEAVNYIPTKGYGSLPYSDANQNPNLVRVYIDAQHDHLQDRVYLLSALVICNEKGVESPQRRRHILYITDKPPDQAAIEKELFVNWIADTVKAVVELAAPDSEGKKRAPIHLIFFNRYEQRILLDGLARNFSAVLGATPFYDFMTQLAAFDSPIATFLDEEIRELKNYPMVCQSLQSVAAYLKFDWNKGENYREIFKERMFDFWGKLDNPDGSSSWYTNRSRFSSQIPLEYAYAAWSTLPSPDDKALDPFAPYRSVKLDQIKGFQLRRLDAIEWVTKDFKGNYLTEKQPFNLPDITSFTDKARTLAAALDEFLTIERHVELTAWKTTRHIAPERRVLMGETLLVSYHESDQPIDVVNRNRENERRRLLAEQYREAQKASRPGVKQIRLTKEQKAETAWSHEGMLFRLRIETASVDCELEEALSLTRIEENSRLILYPRLVYDERLPVNQRADFTPTPKQMLYGTRADIKKIIIERDTNGRAKSGYVEVQLQSSFKSIERGYAFKSIDRPLINAKYYMLDADPNNYYGYWCAEVTEALCKFEDGEETGHNTLYDRLTNPKQSTTSWPVDAEKGQARFLAGLDALKAANALHDFEPSKRAYIGSRGHEPILLVQGPPGTGKSYSTAFAIFARIQGAMAAGIKFHVYVSCKTHAATDVLLENIRNVQEKLQKLSNKHPNIFAEYFDTRLINTPIFRVSPKDTLPNGVIALAKDGSKSGGHNNVDELAQYQWCIVAALPGGIRGMVRGKWSKDEGLLGHYFCHCLILDEASQMNLPEAMMAALPLYPDGQLIVVGDHRQMPPIVHHAWDSEPRRTFQEYKTYQSLFETLLTLEPSMIKFEESFRLHTVMAEFLREEIYWKDGIDYHSNKTDLLKKFNHNDDFVAAILAPEHPIVVIVHNESESQTRNIFEQELIAPILNALANKNLYGLDAIEGLGVVVPHRMQRAALQTAFPFLQVRYGSSNELRSAIDTVERFQGGERDVILVSATESDREYVLASSKFLLDPRRLTVAMSRAKEKMVLVAARSVFSIFDPDEETFANLQMWKNLLRHHCTHKLWQGERLGKSVEVWGTELTEVIAPELLTSVSSSQINLIQPMATTSVVERKVGVQIEQLKPGVIIKGPIFSEPVQIITVTLVGNSIRVIAEGLQTNQVHKVVLNPEQLTFLEATPDKEPFDGDAQRFRLGVEAHRLALAYEYDPYFSLSIARVDPLPHQLEAVYDYFIKLPRIRFLLADDPGAGKTIMAGLLLKELKIRGLVKRTLIVTPANLSFQWQREMSEKFRETFKVIRSDVLRANYGSNPWQEENQVITSVSWVSRIDDAKESLLRSHWDLIIVDEAHKMSAYSPDKKTLNYQLGEALSGMTDHYLLMTATPHKGDPTNFCLFLELLDKDVYGDVASLEEAMRRNNAPFYLRRTKEALVTFPDPVTGQVKKLFTNRRVDTIEFRIDNDEWDFYYALTEYVEDQSIKASMDDSARGRAIAFTMAMLQRRFASSVYAVRRSLERMREKRQEILRDPEKYRREQIAKKLPEEFDELPEEEQKNILEELESVVASYDPVALREEIQRLGKLIDQACNLEKREIETKLLKLKDVITKEGIFTDPKMKMLIFTEHKDTLDYLAGDGKDNRPFGKLREWGLTVTQIHGGMKIGDRNTPNTRIYSEREFREDCQVLIATEAAGEGINLQFCWFMINYDIPWNPVRLEQRMGRIHRYGQEKDCLILNFVSTNTREGSVLQKLFERIKKIEEDLDPKQTGKIFNVLGDIFPANQLERMIRDMYSRNLTEDVIKSRIVEEVDTEHFRKITHSTLEGLAKRELNLSAIIGKSAEARERRLVPEVIRDFFINAASLAGITPKEAKAHSEIYRIGRTPRILWAIGDRLEPRFGKLGREYKQIVFDKKYLTDDPTLEWITPGHPLFECVREEVTARSQDDLRRGAIFFDINRQQPARLDVYSASIRDGRSNVLHRRLFVVETAIDGTMEVRQPTLFLDLVPGNADVNVPDDDHLPNNHQVEHYLIEKALQPFLAEISIERKKETETISQHLEISLTAIIDRLQCQFAELIDLKESGSKESGLDGRIKQMEDRLDELNERLERRRDELRQERNCTIADINHYGRAWVLPHPERKSPEIAPIVRDEDIERIAVDAVIAYEEARGWQVESVEKENKGFDLISRRPHPEDPKTCIEVRFIEVKGRSEVGEVALTTNEYRTATRLKQDYWLYVVYNCINTPEIHIVQNPAQLSWQPLVKIEHYYVGAKEILNF